MLLGAVALAAGPWWMGNRLTAAAHRPVPVPADLAVEAEAATIVAMRMAGATDSAVRGDETETLLRRIEQFIQQHPEQWHVPHRIWAGSP